MVPDTWQKPTRIVLASASPFRRRILENAGLEVAAVPAGLDERALEAPFAGTGATPSDIAEALACAKALAVSTTHPDVLVLGCDQTLSLDGRILHKPEDMEAARRRLLKLSGKTHALNSAAVLARQGEIIWSHVGVARLTMRTLEPAFVGRHLARVGEAIHSSVGAYQIEGEGIQLFDSVDGDYFTIVGLPLLPLLAALRKFGAIDA